MTDLRAVGHCRGNIAAGLAHHLGMSRYRFERSITQEDWDHEAGGDRAGLIELKDGRFVYCTVRQHTKTQVT